MAEEEEQLKDDLRGRQLKLTFRDHEPGVYGEVTDLQTGEQVSHIIGIRFDLDMRRLPDRRIQATVLVRTRTERWKQMIVEIPIVFIQDFSLSVHLDSERDIRRLDHEVLGEFFTEEKQ